MESEMLQEHQMYWDALNEAQTTGQTPSIAPRVHFLWSQAVSSGLSSQSTNSEHGICAAGGHIHSHLSVYLRDLYVP